jgi:hypothetical protein
MLLSFSPLRVWGGAGGGVQYPENHEESVKFIPVLKIYIDAAKILNYIDYQRY